MMPEVNSKWLGVNVNDFTVILDAEQAEKTVFHNIAGVAPLIKMCNI